MDKPNKHGKHEINADLEAGIGTYFEYTKN